MSLTLQLRIAIGDDLCVYAEKLTGLFEDNVPLINVLGAVVKGQIDTESLFSNKTVLLW